MLDINILTDHLDLYMEGFGNTVKASLLALAGSFVLGVIFAVMRISTFRLLRIIGTAYVEFFRNIPLLLIVMFFYLGSGNLGLNLDGFEAGTIGLAIYTSAFIAEAIRAGILAVPKGQVEAGRSSGLTYLQTMQYIVLLQAIKIVIPPLGNQFLNLIKNSSVLGVVAGLDLMYFGDLINSETFKVFGTYIFVAMFYLLLTIPLSLIISILERRLARNY
ncbi:amino acid ABC transporter permease [Paenibacillus larvae]|uniref:Amino acid ABC transporter permease n=1 Tax=Paenibacillus larvae TaxID=1464 RepID=A0AAP5N476_9BACL|nr:amino acid ABC transporter permease [Paenibacillus larvae]AQR77119.1 glutamine ABC transporter permease [Paenibacillus larvae subsp. larvae]AVF21928.1 putative glutamine ABC transporter permease protein GlnM [Paenibacillus larvae subsp. larvae]ETK27293.1 putative glutamine ABC transporter permease protein GlnM [Paenibacillus larvae subsp. larvae DSM 25719]MCY7476347.1 amino acid ABC transporter permease [Paenibacillus larvae]MCY7489714.1 amino acid ABC transporter permease [Paenibacillus la